MNEELQEQRFQQIIRLLEQIAIDVARLANPLMKLAPDGAITRVDVASSGTWVGGPNAPYAPSDKILVVPKNE